jgi:nucleoside-triphosphatase THEP1
MELPRRCVILTGSAGSGKTRALGRFAEVLAAEGRRVRAILQRDLGRGPGGEALGFEMEFLSAAEGRTSMERSPLARALPEGELPASGSLAFGRFLFDRSAFAKASAFARSSAGAEDELLCLDEIGRLELQRGEGLMDCLEFALSALAGGGELRVLACAAREDCVNELQRLVREAGLASHTFEARREAEALAVLRSGLD